MAAIIQNREEMKIDKDACDDTDSGKFHRDIILRIEQKRPDYHRTNKIGMKTYPQQFHNGDAILMTVLQTNCDI